MDKQEALTKLKKYNQEHILNEFESLEEKKQKILLEQIERINFEQIIQLYEKTKKPVDLGDAKIKPISFIDKEKISDDKKKEYRRKGASIIKEGKYAVVTMAGGQGTRLGHHGPKGTFIIGNGISKSLFESFAEVIKDAQNEYEQPIPWYIMTSRENNKQTIDFFKEHEYFGLEPNNVKFFIQGELPMIDTRGKLIINEEGIIKEAADGHGGVFEALTKDGMVKDMKERGIEWMFIAGVDNILANMIDPILIGLAIEKNVLAAGKSVVKSNPKEKVGVFCRKDNRPSVIEYTEISDEMAEMIDENGELLYGESHILCNMFNIRAIEEISKNKLPYHAAFKKATYKNEQGEIIKPESPNAYKFEAFIFDAFERLDDMAIMRVKREEEFAPVKNAEGVDSPDTARKLYLDYIKNKK